MTSDECENIVIDFASSVDPKPPVAGWYIFTAKGGPNAVLKIIIPPVNGRGGYILTAARRADTAVIDHEVDVLNRLNEALPDMLKATVPSVVAHRSWAGRPYFAIAIYESVPGGKIRRKLTRTRRFQWVSQWLTELSRCTLASDLTTQWLEEEYASTIALLQADPAIAHEVKDRVQKSYETIIQQVGQLPSVCCHGDIWARNILWSRSAKNAVVIDWGAARWPGLPCVDLCRYALGTLMSESQAGAAIKAYCKAIDLDPAIVSPLYDLYNVFVKTESDVTCTYQPQDRFDPFAGDAGVQLQRRCLQLTNAIGV